MQIAEVALSADAAADARLRVGHGQHERVVWACQVYDAHHSAAAHYSHLGFHSVELAAVDYEVVVAAFQAVRHHGGRDELVAFQLLLYQLLGQRAVVPGGDERFAQSVHFALQADVLLVEVLIHLLQIQVGEHVRVDAIDACHSRVGRTKPYAALIAVEAEQYYETDAFQQDEQEDVVVLVKKVE